MFWYRYGWWWWWIAFLLLFFFLPLGYGWGHRGWGPWYRRRRSTVTGPPGSDLTRRPPEDVQRPPARDLGGASPRAVGEGWGWVAIALWIVLALALIWFIVAVAAGLP